MVDVALLMRYIPHSCNWGENRRSAASICDLDHSEGNHGSTFPPVRSRPYGLWAKSCGWWTQRRRRRSRRPFGGGCYISPARRYQCITGLLGNPLVISDAIMEPFAREVLERAAAGGEPLSLILDQSQMSERHQVLMMGLRWGECVLPLAWRVEQTDGAIGFEIQRSLLGAVAPWLPEQAKVRLLGDRFYGTAGLIGWGQGRGWDYRLRLKGNLVVFDGAGRTTTGQCAKDRVYYLENVELTGR